MRKVCELPGLIMQALPSLPAFVYELLLFVQPGIRAKVRFCVFDDAVIWSRLTDLVAT